jgi:acetyl esterase/lipase
MFSKRGWWAVVPAVLWVACSSSGTPPPDGGPPSQDSGSSDGGPPDAGESAFDAGALTVRFLDGARQPVSTLLYSLPFSIEVTGAPPGEPVQLQTSFYGYVGQATFVASARGDVRTERDAPVDGGYAGIDSEGLIWSATLVGQPVGSSFDVQVTATATDAGATATLVRPGMGTGFDITRVDAGPLPGVFFGRADAGPQPALLVLGGSECNLQTTVFVAAWLTTMGYQTLAVDYCHGGFIREVPLESLHAALDALAARPSVDPQRLGVMGGSRGGELTLQLAADEPRLRAAVAMVPSPYRWADTQDGTDFAWTRGDAGLPRVPVANVGPSTEPLPGGLIGYRSTPAFTASVEQASPAALSAATIPVGSSNASLLLIGAGDDGLWPSCRFTADALALLADAGHYATHPLDQRLCLEQAGHVIGPPGWSTQDGYSLSIGMNQALVLGGTVAGRGRAGRAADSAMRAFLKAALGP